MRLKDFDCKPHCISAMSAGLQCAPTTLVTSPQCTPTVSTVRIIWRCSKPNDQEHAKICKKLMRQAAQMKGMDTAEIRRVIFDHYAHGVS